MPTRVKVSVIVPVYNSEGYIKECIRSILRQKKCEIELILIDDGSTDKSLQYMKAYKAQDKRVCIIEKSHAGVSEARNCGIAHAAGKYIMFVDADDRIFDTACCRLVSAAEEHHADIVLGNYEYEYGHKILKRLPRLKERGYVYDDIKDILIDDGTMTGILLGSVCGNLYRMEYLRSKNILFEKDVKINEDGLFNIDCVCKDAFIWQMDADPVYIYRQWKNGKDNIFFQKMEAFKICDEVLISRAYKLMSEPVFIHQMMLRKLTECFQLSVAICESETYSYARKEMKALWHMQDFTALEKMISNEISAYKNIFYKMIRKNRYLVFYSIIRYLYPILKQIIIR